MIIPLFSVVLLFLTHEYQIFSLSLHFLISLVTVKEKKNKKFIKNLFFSYNFNILIIFFWKSKIGSKFLMKF